MTAANQPLAGEVPDLLREFACTAALSVDDLLVLASRCRLERLPAGRKLFVEGDQDSWELLLVEGALELAAADGRTHRLEAGTPAASHPVARLKPRRFNAHAVTPVTLLRIDGKDLGDWLSAPAGSVDENDGMVMVAPGMLLEELDGDEIGLSDEGPLREHHVRIVSGDLVLPSLPAIALEARRVIDRDDANAAKLARVLLNDPAITAKLLRAANSPLFYGRVAVDNCERAVLRLGLRTTRQLVMAFALREVFRSDQPVLERLAVALWNHSTSVAALSFVLARRLGGFDPEEAQLAGLLHDIGAVPVLGYAAGEQGLQEDGRAVATLAAALRVTLGSRLLEEWAFGAAVVKAAVHAEDWWRESDGPADLADLVMVAQCMSLLGSVHAQRIPPLARLPAFKRLCGDSMGVDDVLALVAEAEGQIREVRSLLQG